MSKRNFKDLLFGINNKVSEGGHKDDENLIKLAQEEQPYDIWENFDYAKKYLPANGKDWDKILPLLKRIADSQKEPVYDRYSELRKYLPVEAVNWLVPRLQPMVMARLDDDNDVRMLCYLLKRYTDVDVNFDTVDMMVARCEIAKLYRETLGYKDDKWGKVSLPYNTIKLLIKDLHRNIILHGAPGTGKTYTACKLAKLLAGNSDERWCLVQFHPSYDYTDFVEGLRPVRGTDGSIGFERRDGAFMALCRKAVSDSKNKYVMVIDEINRGELSRIFGELFFAIDPDYRGEKGKVLTQYQNLWTEKYDGGDKFYVPENVYVIGTMNDVDRSVEPIDFALRRRFHFVKVGVKESYLILDNNKDKSELIKRMNALNGKLKAIGLGEEYQFGAAYFNSGDDVKTIWCDRIEGTLAGYLQGRSSAKDELKKCREAYDPQR